MVRKKKVKLYEGAVKKGGVNQISDTNKPKFTPAAQQKTSGKTTKNNSG